MALKRAADPIDHPGDDRFGLMARKLDRDRAEERIARAESSGAARFMSTSSSESLRLNKAPTFLAGAARARRFAYRSTGPLL
jgi:hypothetical protein